MKNLSALIPIILLTMLISSCDELITKDVDVPIYFEVFTEINVPGDTKPDKAVDFIAGGKFDILSHPDVANAIGTPDKIKKVKISKIQYEYKNFTGNVDAVVSGTISLPRIKLTSYDDIVEDFIVDPVKVAESIVLNEKYTLNGNFDGVNEYLSENVLFEYAFVGRSTHNPADFYIVLKVTASVTVEASLDGLGNYKS